MVNNNTQKATTLLMSIQKYLIEVINMVTELTADNFKNEVLDSTTPVIVDFWASWCGPCKMMAPVFEELSGEYEGKLKFAKISTEEHPEMAEQNHITGIPCLIVFKEGKEVDRIVGYAPKSGLKDKIEKVMEKL
jgi:thioredoxin 1